VSNVLKQEAVYAVTGIVTVLMLLEYFFFASNQIWAETIRTWAVIIFNISLFLGAIRLIMSHSVRIQQQRRDWQFSIILMAIFVVMLLTGVAGYISTGVQTDNGIYNWLFNYVYTPLGATLYPITGFYIFSAAYRAFRARNIDATLMLLAGIFVMLKNAPVGEAIWVGFKDLGNWVQFTGQVPGMRTLAIVGALGLIAFGFRALLGKERGFYAGGGE
jgi:hypothetical protein